MTQHDLRISAFIVVGIRKVLLFFLLVEDLEFHEINSLLNEINVSKLLKMKDNLGYGSERHL